MIRRIFTGLLSLLFVLGGGFYLYLLSSLPQTDGRLAVPGPKAEIRIERDADGVPLIIAQDDEDDPSKDLRIVSSTPQGFVLARIFSELPSLYGEAETQAKALTCASEPAAK